MPKELSLMGGSPICTQNNINTSCSVDQTGLVIMLTGPFIGGPVGQGVLIQVGISSILNPRTFKTTEHFNFSSFDTLGQLIDQYSQDNTAVTMTQAASFLECTITNISSLIVGDSNVQYTFEITSGLPLYQGDMIVIQPPPDISLPTFPLTLCQSPQQSNLTCSESPNNQILLLFSDNLPINTTFQVILQAFTNPSSGVMTAPFVLSAYDSTYSLMMATNGTESQLAVQMLYPFLITSGATIATDTAVPTAPIVITIQFQLAHNLPQNSSLVITYPQQLSPNQTSLKVVCPHTTPFLPIQLNASANQIIGTKFFSQASFSGQTIQLQISGFNNPNVQTPTDPFIIDYFTPSGMVIDRVAQQSLVVQSKCNYPCKDCGSDPTICTACMTSDMSPLTLLQVGQCVQSCSQSFYVLGNICDECDSNCQTCTQSKKICTTCPSGMYLYNSQCVSTCSPGYFTNNLSMTCDQCISPCQTCDVSVTSCSSCQANFFLQESQCLTGCPPDHFIANTNTWTCDACDDMCLNCYTTTSQCTLCKPSFNLNGLTNTCFNGPCPAGVTVEVTPGICSGCKPQCLTCGNSNTSYCTSCSDKMYYSPADNDCQVACRSNQAASKDANGAKQCINCAEGCTKCLDGSPNVCTVCEAGLVNFNFTSCLTECPANYTLNALSGNCLDSSIHCLYGYALNASDQCELSVQQCLPGYVLNDYFSRCIPLPGFSVPFPTLALLLILTIILWVLNRCSKQYKETRFVPTLIVLWSFFEIPLFIAQVFFAASFQHWFNMVVTIVAIVLHFPLGFYATVHIIPIRILKPLDNLESSELESNESQPANQDAELDIAFKHWANAYHAFLDRLRRWALLYNHKMLRLLYCGFRGQPEYKAVFDHAEKRLHRPLLKAAVANMVLVYLLIIIADVFALKTIVRWGYQFTIFCIESLLLSIVLSILLVVDYCQHRTEQQGYYKVTAKSVNQQNVFSGYNEDDSEDNLKRQRSTDRHVVLLKQLNADLDQWQLYSGNFDKLGQYQDSPRKRSPERCWSTQGHYKDNRGGFFEYEILDVDGETRRPPEEDSKRGCESEISESDYPMPVRLSNFRAEIEALLKHWLEEDAARTKTLDYKASFHILDSGRNHDSMGGESTDFVHESSYHGRGRQIGGPHRSTGVLQVIQKPPKFNLSDVMGNFQTDDKGNLIIVKKQGPSDESNLVDGEGRRVNRRGYLIDDNGNVVTRFGDLVVPREELDPATDDIPPELFRSLFIPEQVLSQDFKRKKRATTGRPRPQSSLRPGSSSSGQQHSRETAIVSRLGRNIENDGEAARISIDQTSSLEEDLPTEANEGRQSLLGKKKIKKGLGKKKGFQRSKTTRPPVRKSRLEDFARRNPLDETGLQQVSDRERDDVYQINIQTKAQFGDNKKRKALGKGRVKSPPLEKVPDKKKQEGIIKKEQRIASASQKRVTLVSPAPRREAKVAPQPKMPQQPPKGELQKMIHDIEDRSTAMNSIKQHKVVNLDRLIDEVTKPKVAKVKQTIQPRIPVPSRKRPPRDLGPFDPTLYRIHLDVEDQLSARKRQLENKLDSSIQGPDLDNSSVQILNPGRNWKRDEDVGSFEHSSSVQILDPMPDAVHDGWMHPSQQIQSSLDQRPRLLLGSNLRNNDLRPISGQPARYEANTMLGRFYPQRPPSSSYIQQSSALSPTASLHYQGSNQHPHILHESTERGPLSSLRPESSHLTAKRAKNQVTNAYAQDLTQLMHVKKPAATVEERSDDPYVVMKKIFQK